MFKGKLPHFLYIFHFAIIIFFWFLFFIIFFFPPINLNFKISKTIFYLFEFLGFIFIAFGFFYLRKSSLSEDLKKMFSLSLKGDLITFLGFIFTFLFGLIYKKYVFSQILILGVLTILQTHFPLVEDDSLYPEGVAKKE